MDDKGKLSLQEEMARALGEKGTGRSDALLLVVEDDPDIREALGAVLGLKYEVVGVSSGRRILEMIDGYGPALVILDVNLPGRDGFELCRMIRSSPKYRHLPVMFLTVRRDDESFVKSIQTNADAYLNKPFEVKELKDTVERLVGCR